MKVSIVIPVYNTRPYLRECIDSALDQTYGNTEIIAVDGGSTDGSLDLLKEYGGAVRTVSLPGSGISEALNAGIRAMTGEWLKRLDSDDILAPNAVAALAAAAEQEAAARGAAPARLVPYGDSEEIGEDGSLLHRPLPSPSNPLTTVQQGAMMLDVPYGLSTMSLIHRSAFDKAGMFDGRYGMGEDVELNLRLLMRGKCRMLHVPGVLYRYRRRRGQATGAGSLAVARGLRRVARDCWAGMDARTRAEYAAEYKRLLRAKLFLYGVWARANRGYGAPVVPSCSGGGERRPPGPRHGQGHCEYTARQGPALHLQARGCGSLTSDSTDGQCVRTCTTSSSPRLRQHRRGAGLPTSALSPDRKASPTAAAAPIRPRSPHLRPTRSPPTPTVLRTATSARAPAARDASPPRRLPPTLHHRKPPPARQSRLPAPSPTLAATTARHQ